MQKKQWIPENKYNHEKNIRHVGVEIEFSGISVENITQAIVDEFGGTIVIDTLLEARVTNTELGDFIVELDAQYFKDLIKHKSMQKNTHSDKNSRDETLNFLEQFSMELIPEDVLAKAAAQFVPWEIVSPPLTVNDLHRLEPLVKRLRVSGALGTRYSPLYAFGVHLNPELPDLSSATVVRYLKAYFCLYEWIYEQENIDFARRITPYINHFDKKYIEKIIAEIYHPTLNQLIDDYLKHNPTRNRSLDLLPLFSFLDRERVKQANDDPRIKSRPTFHFRLPNCDIDNPDWNIHIPWQHWLAVEALANDEKKLAFACAEYSRDLQRLTRSFDSKWIAIIESEILTPAIGKK